MRALPFTNVVAAVVFFASQAVMGLTEIKPRRVSAASTAPGYDRATKHWVLVTAQLAIVLAFAAGWFVTGASVGRALRVPSFVAGIVLVYAGIALRRWAIATLGAQFTHDVRVADDQPVIDDGPYRLVRHPSYLGAVISFAGIGLALGNWLALAAVLVVPMVGYVRRIAVEEAALRDRLGERYARYAAGRARLFPGVW